MPTVVIDVERLKNIHCGLGQFSLHLSRAIMDACGNESGNECQPILLLRSAQQKYYAGRSVRFLDVTTCRREPAASLARPLLRATGFHERCDIWHTTHQDSKCLPLDRRTPLVLTIHDLNILREKQPAALRRRLRSLQRKVDRATVITTASQFAADEIRKHLNVGTKEIVVITHGVCVTASSESKSRPAFLPPDPFLFTIGDITPKKNFHVLIDFLKELSHAGRPDLRLVIAGAKRTEYAARIERQIHDAGLKDRVILPGTVCDADREWLYRNCEAFLFPSLSEGFGLPVIEAMSCGRPVFLSNKTSLPEVGGPLAFYWRDFSARSMTDVFQAGMSLVGQDPQYEAKLRQHASQFTWQRAAESYLALYRRVLASANSSQSILANESQTARRVA